MPHQTEPSANNVLGNLLRQMMRGSKVLSENTQTFPDHPGRHADVLVMGPGRSPVPVEAEFLPAPEAEQDAAARLGLKVAGEPRTIESAVAVRYPSAVQDCYDLEETIKQSTLTYAVLYADGTRFPDSGWLEGGVEDLGDLVRLVSVPQREVEEAADTLQQGIEAAAVILDELDQTNMGIPQSLAKTLEMANVPQTRRMACAIIANALVFHERIAGMYDGIKPLNLVCGPGVANPQTVTIAAWSEILKINYWPIFGIAQDLLGQLTAGAAAQILEKLRDTAQQVDAAGVTNAHDLTGRIFQRLIADRKFLATFYTLPASAALLARLAVAKMDGVDWSDADAIGKLRIGDFACGTGALLSAVYEQIAARHERTGGDPVMLHRVMMEDVLYGCDVMPSAVHITSATLSGVQPALGFEKSRIYTMPYGRQKDESVAIGSLELLQSSQTMTLFNTSDQALQTGSLGEETAAQINVDIPDEGFDLVIMNPPFTNNAAKEAANVGVFAPAFAAFGTGDADQRAMARRLGTLSAGTCYHGNAGVASAFVALANRKLKPGGILALVLPLSAAGGMAWQGFRSLLGRSYRCTSVLSIAGAASDETSFSSDTGMGECLVIAQKCGDGNAEEGSGSFITLATRIKGFGGASAVAAAIGNADGTRNIDDGPFGGTPLLVGNELAGQVIDAPFYQSGSVWGAVRTSDMSVVQTAYALERCSLWLPGTPAPVELKTTRLNKIGKMGFHHRDIGGQAPRAPFELAAPSPTSTYPCLWRHDAKTETHIVCQPDSQLAIRPELEEKANQAWATAGRGHLNRDFRFNSQPLAVAFTERPSMGGRAWPNVNLDDAAFDIPLALWSNSTLGVVLYWWHSNRQQSGRGTSSVRSLETMYVLDFRSLSDAQLGKAREIFDELRDKDLKPAYLADADPNRALLDRRVVCDLLGFGEDVYEGVRRLAAKWCAEPSVHGGKARPKGAELVI